MPGLPTHYYFAIGGVLVLLALLLIKRAENTKAKAAVGNEGQVGGFAVAEGWAEAGIAGAPDDRDTQAAGWTATPVDESKRAARARARADAKAAAGAASAAKAAAKADEKAQAAATKAAEAATKAHAAAVKKALRKGEPIPEFVEAAAAPAAATSRIKGHRRSKGSPAPLSAPAAPEAPPLIEQDGWLTTPAEALLVAGETPSQLQPTDLFPSPAQGADIPQQFAPAGPPQQYQSPAPPAPQYAMAGAPDLLAEAAAAAAQAESATPQSAFPEPIAAPAPPTSFSEIVASAPPAPVVPEAPVGPYTYGARTILPGK